MTKEQTHTNSHLPRHREFIAILSQGKMCTSIPVSQTALKNILKITVEEGGEEDTVAVEQGRIEGMVEEVRELLLYLIL